MTADHRGVGTVVLKGAAGRPSRWYRPQAGLSAQPQRTLTGVATASWFTITSSPWITAFAHTNFPSAPASAKPVHRLATPPALPTKSHQPPPRRSPGW